MATVVNIRPSQSSQTIEDALSQIPGMMGQYRQIQNAEQAQDIAKSQLIMQQAQFELAQTNARKEQSAKDALLESTNDYNLERLASPDGWDAAFADNSLLHNYNAGYTEYKSMMNASKQPADLSAYDAQRTKLDRQYMAKEAQAFNALRSTIARKYAKDGWGNREVDLYMQAKHNGDNVYNKFEKVFGLLPEGQKPEFYYKPPEYSPDLPHRIYEGVKGALYDPEVSADGEVIRPGGLNWIGELVRLGLVGAGGVGVWKSPKMYRYLKGKFGAKAAKDIINKEGLKRVLKNIKVAPINRQLRGPQLPGPYTPWNTERLGPLKEQITKTTPKKILDMAKGVVPYVAPSIGRAGGELIGGETGGDIGQAGGTAYLTQKAGLPAAKSFLKYLAGKFPAIAGKAVGIAASDAHLPIGDILALGFTATQLVSLWKEWSNTKGEPQAQYDGKTTQVYQ